MTIEELHQKLNGMADQGMQDDAYLPVPRKKKRAGVKSKLIKTGSQGIQKEFYIQTRLFD